MASTYRRCVCADGFSVSIQADEMKYCTPRREGATVIYKSVELGFPSHKDAIIHRYAENPDKPTETVYGYVPTSEVYLLLVAHGGVVEGDVPKGIPVYGGNSYGEKK